MVQERLQKILSRAGIASRRKAEAFILAGKIEINGKVVKELGTRADPQRDRIRLEGRPLVLPKKFQYYAYCKPRGVVVSKKDELGRKGIFDLLKLPKAVNAVGRLDKDSEGLLLLSDDGDFIQQYTHPSYEVPKVYQVQINRLLTQAELIKLTQGINFKSKTFCVSRAKKLIKKTGNWLELELREGHKREIRIMLETLGVKVLRLTRIQHGVVKLGSMKMGQLKRLKQRPR